MNDTDRNKRICPAECAGGLDNVFRKLIHNPHKILKNYVKEGMTVLDFGCGPGFFTLSLAEIVGKAGKIIAVDLQEAMLDKLRQKISGKEIEQQIVLRKCTEDNIVVNEKVDLVLAFYVVHELPNPNNFFNEIYSIIKSGGKLLFIEPIFHVSQDEFNKEKEMAEKAGFKMREEIKVHFSRGVLLEKL